MTSVSLRGFRSGVILIFFDGEIPDQAGRRVLRDAAEAERDVPATQRVGILSFEHALSIDREREGAPLLHDFNDGEFTAAQDIFSNSPMDSFEGKRMPKGVRSWAMLWKAKK